MYLELSIRRYLFSWDAGFWRQIIFDTKERLSHALKDYGDKTVYQMIRFETGVNKSLELDQDLSFSFELLIFVEFVFLKNSFSFDS